MLFLLFACSTTTKTDSDTAKVSSYAYMDGVYGCCAEGEGTECCAEAEAGMCFEYGGLYEACIADGGDIEGKVICAVCCSGQDAREPMVETTDSYDGYPEGCGPGAGPPDILVCVTCGDGVCGAGENKCVCPEDCAG